MENVCAKFEEANPGVKVELTIDKKLEDIITPAMKSGDYPDVIMRAVGSESALTETFVKDNNVEEMTDVLEMTVPGEDVTVKDKTFRDLWTTLLQILTETENII